MSTWTLERFVARSDDGFLLAGLAYPGARAEQRGNLAQLAADLPAHGAWLTGWSLLGEALLGLVQRDLWFVLAPMLALLLLSLGLAFRRLSEALLSLAALALSGLLLLAVMRLAGWSWNLLNLMALPLLLGSGVDYGIHMQMALRRHGGNLALVRRNTGHALFLCAATTVAGFGSLAWSSNAGLASLGLVCAAGVASAFIVACWLLPSWWLALHRAGDFQSPPVPVVASGRRFQTAGTDNPTALYSRLGWQLGLHAARLLPRAVVELLCRIGAFAYWHAQAQRR